MKRPRSATADDARSMTRAAASAARAPASATIRTVGAASIVRSYLLVEVLLAGEGHAVTRVMSGVGRHQIAVEMRRFQGGQDAERVQGEHGCPSTGRLGLARDQERMAQGVRDDAGPRAGSRDRAPGGHYRVLRAGEGTE